MLVYGVFVQRSGHPSLTSMIACLYIGLVFFHSSGHSSRTGLIYLCTRIYVQSCGHSSLTGLIYLCRGIYVQSCGHHSLRADLHGTTLTHATSLRQAYDMTWDHLHACNIFTYKIKYAKVCTGIYGAKKF